MMTPTAANTNVPSHPYLRHEQFADRQFLRIRRRVALLRLPYAEGESRAQLRRLVEIYDELLR